MEDSSSVNGSSVNGVQPQTVQHDFVVVGIGASAGGVQALKDLFENVPADSGMAYVVILHLSPDYDSQLTNILQMVSRIPVEKVTEKVSLRPNHIYVVPPNASLQMMDNSIVVEPIHTVEERRAPVDIFFRSLAESHGPYAIAVVLSGTGANGSMGIKRIKEKGGAVFVQNPREAEYTDMPRNAIATELADEIANVRDLPAKIITYKKNIGTVAIPATQEALLEEQQASLREIFTQLRIRTGHDFTNYKRATILRRIERRINVRNVHSLQEYATFLRETPEEAQALLKDLLISVTNFFRDKESFHFLEQKIIPAIMQDKTAEDSVRVWVAGCATGEEAYSIGMLLYEQLEDYREMPTIQIFATDIDDAAISAAREGFYTLNDAADVSPERLRRFFSVEGDGYRIKRELRESILFANHNVIKDPPFSRVDLISCRNMLIYLNQAAQNRVMETFHFALNPGGYLFLGSSESVDGANDLYVAVNKENQVFQSRHVTTRPIPVPDNSLPNSFRVKLPDAEGKSSDLKMTREKENRGFERISVGDLHQRLLEQYAPPSLIINENHDVVHISESAGRFLQVSGGEPNTNVLKLIRPELRLELRTALYQSIQKQTNLEVKTLQVQTNGHVETINLHVRPVLRPEDTARGFILILFEPADGEPAKDVVELRTAEAEPIARQLEEEIINLRTQLRLSNELFEIQTEELKASNEELQAMNEELRSAAEELETSKEELQSINEELITVNQELKIKIEEVSQSNNDFQNLINSIDIGTIFLDRNLRVKLFTPAARDVFNLIQADIGRPISDITGQLEYQALISDAESVLQSLQMVEREVQSRNGSVFLMQVLPYRTAEDRISGVVVIFVDITERKQAEISLRKSLEQNNEILESISDAFYAVDADYKFTFVNKKAEELWGRKRETLIGKHYWTEFPEAVDSESYRRHIKAFEEQQVQHFETVSPLIHRWVDGSIYPNSLGGISCYFRDITERKQIQEALRNSEESLRLAIEAGNIGTCDWNYPAGKMRWNDVRFRMYGMEPTDKLMSLDDFFGAVHPDDRERIKKQVLHDVETTGKHTEEYRVLHPDGAVRWILETGRTVEWQNETPARIISVLFDVTEQHTSQEALRESEERYRAIVSQTSVGIIRTNKNGSFIFFNDRVCSMLGYTSAEAADKVLWDLMLPEDVEETKQLFDRLVKEALPFQLEKKLVRKNGIAFWATLSVAPIKDSKGITQSAVAVAVDITGRKQAEEALRETMERFQFAVQATKDVIWEIDFQRNHVWWSSLMHSLFGYSPYDIKHTIDWFHGLVHPEDRRRVMLSFRKAVEGREELWLDEFRYQQASGNYVFVICRSFIIRDKEGKAKRMIGAMQDISERREAEDAVLAVQNSLNTALEAAQMGVWDLDFATSEVLRSLRHDMLLGYPVLQDDWSAEKAKQYLVEEDKAKYDEAYQTLLSTGVFELEARVKQRNGDITWIHYYGRKFTNENGEPTHAAGVIFDVTDRKMVEQKKDEFIGIASHELKTPVTSIKAYTEMLHEQLADGGDMQAALYISKLNGQVNRLARLIRDLLDATRISEGRMSINASSIDINQALRETTDELQRTTEKHKIELKLHHLPPFHGDRERLQQVFVNLLSNAIKYSPEANRITVTSYLNENNINIDFRDYGIGMGSDTKEKLFERFFRSTDPRIATFPGLGLGLYISQQIVKLHKGTIHVKTEQGQGTTFTVVLPLN